MLTFSPAGYELLNLLLPASASVPSPAPPSSEATQPTSRITENMWAVAQERIRSVAACIATISGEFCDLDLPSPALK